MHWLGNMLTSTLAIAMQNEYPEKWPSFWKDLLGLLPQGPGVVDMFCRILVAIDDDVISLDISRQACIACSITYPHFKVTN